MRAFLLLLTLLSCSLPHSAYCDPEAPPTAETKTQAQRFFTAGVSLQKTEDFEGAIAAYETSLQLFPTKSALFNLANCQRALHRYADAWNSLQRLHSAFGAELAEPMASTSLAQLEELANLTGLLTIETAPTGATISIDGKPVGTTPWTNPLRVTIGQHAVQATLDGHATKESTVRVSPKQTLVLALELEPTPATSPVESVPPAPTPEQPRKVNILPDRTAPPSPVVPKSETDANLGPAWRTAGWVGMALGVAGIAIGARSGLLAIEVDDRLQHVCEGSHCASRSGSDIERLERLTTSANVFVGAGVLLVAAGTTLVLWESSPKASEHVDLSFGPGSVFVGGAF